MLRHKIIVELINGQVEILAEKDIDLISVLFVLLTVVYVITDIVYFVRVKRRSKAAKKIQAEKVSSLRTQ